ncbi:mobile mystery protein A [Demequina sp. TTPB684]|uniref:mobile mystery protein A n=1 Tax=unclassified Demequina TaxID=2620311 RepID=UPI001CF5811A|nr:MULTISPECIES: mobile mystery protein A [unclassified Demequina]MCB2413952.1 mobile mystery protein A [Demequina sp. TTPB684]UPU88695.1 mobile mystery protein A [Demequina sp. TMPB413]
MQTRRLARRQLDLRSRHIRTAPVDVFARPQSGWIRAVRDALGMSTRDMAARLGVTSMAVSKLEASERAGTIGLDTLTRAADALGCDVVYALVPRVPLEQQVHRQAEVVARAELGPVATTMALEDQSVDAQATQSLVEDRIAQLIDSRSLWRV